jgi:hypothetical protein
MQSKTLLRFALDATPSCIGERIEDGFLIDPVPPAYPTRRQYMYSDA